MSSIRDTRISLGLSRKQLAELAGVSVGAVCSIEDGKSARDKNAAEKITAALKIATAPPDVENLGRIYTAVRPPREGWVVSTSWNGLEPGRRFTAENEEGSFTFIRHVAAAAGRWVDGYGGRSGYGSHRSFREDRVRVL